MINGIYVLKKMYINIVQRVHVLKKLQNIDIIIVFRQIFLPLLSFY